MSAPRPVPPEESGFVLPMVLAILIMVSAAAVVATDRQRTRIGVTDGQARSLRLQGLADGAARLVATGFVLERTRGVASLGLPRNGAPIACDLPEGRRLALSVQDHGGLIDLNAAPRPLLEATFRALGIGDADALTLAAEVMDYRDPDDNPEPSGGAEAPQYTSRGLAYGPRNGPFSSVDEIERLPSLSAEQAERLRGALTVYNPGGGLDPALVPVRALVAGVAGDGLRPYLARSSGQYVEVRTSVSDGRGRATRSAMVSAGGTGTGTLVLSWQPDGPELARGAPHPACGPLAAALIRP